jgi:hypothetical protein
MPHVDLQKLALRLKIVEMLKEYTRRQGRRDAHMIWRRLIQAN